MNRIRDVLLGGVSGIALALAGAAYAQNIVSSVQLSQDPRGSVGFDASNNMFLLKGQHLGSNTAAGGKAPSLTTCGTAPTITGTDFAFTLTTGSTGTSCIVTFGAAFGAAPICVITANGTATQPTYTTTAASVTLSVDIASTVYQGICIAPS
jgi:hypothetical protein